MNPAGFVSSWLPRIGANTTTANNRNVCSKRPSMNLVSHEKLEVLFTSESSELATYKLELEIPADFSKEKRRRSITALKKNASFKGFRKGTIPPFIMKDIPAFVLQDCIDELLQSALKELKLEATEGEAAEPKLDLKEIKDRFTVGEDLVFTCEIPLRKVLTLDAVSEEDEILDIQSASLSGEEASEIEDLRKDLVAKVTENNQ